MIFLAVGLGVFGVVCAVLFWVLCVSRACLCDESAEIATVGNTSATTESKAIAGDDAMFSSGTTSSVSSIPQTEQTVPSGTLNGS